MGEAGIANHAQDRAGRVAEHGRYPAAVPGDLWPAHRVYAPEDRVEPPALDSMLDRIGVQTQLEELCAGDHPMLTLCQRPHPSRLRTLMTHRSVKCSAASNSPSRRRESARPR